MIPIDYDRVADLYDTYVPFDFDVPFFVEEATKVSGEVLELMAGTGRVSLPLVQAGVSLTCVDASRDMLAVLERKLQAAGLSANLLHADVRSFSPEGSFTLAILPFNSFSELLTPEDRLATLTVIYNCLEQGGCFICTLHNPRIRLKNADGCLRLNGSYPYEGGRLCLFGAESYDPQAHIVNRMQFYELYDEQGILQSKRCLEMQFCPLNPSELATLQERMGFKTVALYGDYSRSEFNAETSPFAIAILQK